MAELQEQNIGFIGGGAMGDALIGGLLAAGVPPAQLRVAELDPARRKLLEETRGVACTEDAECVALASDVVVLALKPNVVGPVLEGLGAGEALARPLWISIAAGVTLERLAARLPGGTRIVRAMPNTPALVGAGATAICANPAATPADLELAQALFRSVGSCWQAPAETLLDAVTGLSGSGPAYVFVFLEALGDAGVRMGLPRDAAYELAFQTVYGAAKLALTDGRHPGVLKDQVTSPGGTTIAGLERLEAGGLRAAVHAAVERATQRARELAGES